jgi:hypothetical protein
VGNAEGYSGTPGSSGKQFYLLYECGEMMNMDMAKKSGQQFLALEKETGVNLDCYYKLKIRN